MRPIDCKIAVAAIAALVLAAGCIVIDGKSTEWRESTNTVPNYVAQGPGFVECQFLEYARDKYETDNGRYLSLGLFPGSGEMWEHGRVGYLADNWFLWGFATVMFNMAVVPTIDSLFIVPFDRDRSGSSISGMGLIGAHRWKDGGGTSRVVKRGEREVLVTRRAGAAAPAPPGFTAKNKDGTKVYYEWPGFDAIQKEVKASGRVDVLFSPESGQQKLRRFKRARRDRKEITYEDLYLKNGSALWTQRTNYLASRKLLADAGRLVLHRGYGAADDALQNECAAIAAEAEKAAKTPASATSDALEKLRARLESAQASLEACEANLRLADLAEFADGWPNEDRLRDFARQEKPEVWEAVVAIRANLAERQAVLERMRMGMTVAEISASERYRRLSREREDERAALSRIFRCLEAAFIANRKFTALPRRTDFAEAKRRALEEGAKESKSAREKYLGAKH